MGREDIQRVLLHVKHQLSLIYCIDETVQISYLQIEKALRIVNFIFKNIQTKQYGRNFILSDLYHSDKYALLLFVLSRVLFEDESKWGGGYLQKFIY